MKLILTAEEQAFQREVRAFLQAELSDEIKCATRASASVFVEKDTALAWQQKLYRRGWLAPNWPKQFGGAQWSAVQRYLYDLEAAQAGAPLMIPMGLSMVAPVIMKYGSPQQQAEYLPKILSGEHYWCQGYSEPQSGSDLASLKCRAVRDGDHYIVDGTKIWTTHAHYATHIFCLVRTDPDIKPQQGISFLLIDMQTPGITEAPIKSFAGDHDVNQVFFDGVRVPLANRVGEEGQGWTCAKYLLEHERGGTFGSPILLKDLAQLKLLMPTIGDGCDGDMTADAGLRRRLAELELDVYCLQQYEIEVARSPEYSDPAAASIIKTLYTETQQKITELAMDVAGPFAAILDKRRPLHAQAVAHDLPQIATLAPSYLNFRAASIYGGTNEIQRTVIAKAALTAAHAARLDFSEQQQLLQASAESFAGKFYSAQMRKNTEQAAAGYDAQCWEKFIELGWHYLGIPAELDGFGGNYSDWLALAYGLGGGLLIEPLFSAMALPTVVFKHAVDAVVARAGFAHIASGQYRYTLAHAEYQSRYGDAIHTSALAHSSGGWTVSGQKTLIQHATAAHCFLVSARVEGGATIIVAVPATAAGVTIKPYRLMDGRAVADVIFDGVVVSAEALVVAAEKSAATLHELFALGAALCCADSLRQIEALLRLTVEYLNTRSQFGSKLAQFQVLQHRVADMHLHQAMAGAAFQRLLQQVDGAGVERDLAISFAKVQIDKAARYVGQQAIQLHGGIGITEELGLGAHFKRISTNEHCYGDRSWHLERYLQLAAGA